MFRALSVGPVLLTGHFVSLRRPWGVKRGANYGGILGLLAFLTMIVRGELHGNDPTIHTVDCLAEPDRVHPGGLVIGWVAERIVEDSVAGRVAAELAVQEEESKK